MTNQQTSSHEPAKSAISSTKTQVSTFVTGTLRSLLPSESGIALANTDEPLTDAHFEEPVCRNCGEPCTSKFCSNCGQGMAERFTYRDVGKEIWERYRLFEMDTLRMGLRLLVRPGTVAREYVLGARKRYLHPLNLLLVAIGFLVLILNQTHYLVAGRSDLTPVMAQVEAWSQWSFSMGLFAILMSSITIFWKRLGYNIVEQAILAAYTQIAIIAVNMLNLLPLLFFNSSEWLLRHREVSGWYMSWVEVGIVALAFQQFFRVKLPSQWWRLALAVAAYYLLKKGLLLAYARLIVFIVVGQ